MSAKECEPVEDARSVGLDGTAHPSVASEHAELLAQIPRTASLGVGNKRIAWVLARLFLALNGVELHFAAEDAIRAMLALRRRAAKRRGTGQLVSTAGRGLRGA
jgi:prophage maintenance system killer protein